MAWNVGGVGFDVDAKGRRLVLLVNLFIIKLIEIRPQVFGGFEAGIYLCLYDICNNKTIEKNMNNKPTFM